MSRIIVVFLSACLSICLNSNIFATEPSVTGKCDLLVYRDKTEVQDVNGNVEVYNDYIGQKVRIKKTTKKRTEEILTKEDGLRYGFPLRVGMKWGEDPDYPRNDNMYCYYVEKIEDVTVPAGTFKNCFKIVYDTCPDTTTEWYYPGIGVVKSEYHHHGTIINEISELKKIARK